MNLKTLIFAVPASLLLTTALGAQVSRVVPITSCVTAEQFQRALDGGANPNAVARDGWSVLTNAASGNPDPQVIKMLVKAGARVDFTTPIGGDTPLMEAVQRNPNPAVISALVEAGSNVNAKDNHSRTPLILAVFGRHKTEVISILLDAGADPRITDKSGATVLSYIQRYARNLVGTPIYLRLYKLIQERQAFHATFLWMLRS